jgi:Methyltransferase domain
MVSCAEPPHFRGTHSVAPPRRDRSETRTLAGHGAGPPTEPASFCALHLGSRTGNLRAPHIERSQTASVSSQSDHRASLWTYYDTRAADYDGGVSGAVRYFRDLGVEVTPEAIREERREITRQLARLPPATFVDVGAGPGVFTAQLPGSGFALDQSGRALRRLRAEVAGVPVIQADVTALPLAAKAVTRVFAGHLYGHLEPDERATFVAEVRRVADEVVILDSGLPPGAHAEEWQRRSLPDGTTHTVYKDFDIETLSAEVDGDPLFGGRYFVLVRSTY